MGEGGYLSGKQYRSEKITKTTTTNTMVRQGHPGHRIKVKVTRPSTLMSSESALFEEYECQIFLTNIQTYRQTDRQADRRRDRWGGVDKRRLNQGTWFNVH